MNIPHRPIASLRQGAGKKRLLAGRVPEPDSLGQYRLVDLGAIADGATRAFGLADHSRPSSRGRVAIDLRALPEPARTSSHGRQHANQRDMPTKAKNPMRQRSRPAPSMQPRAVCDPFRRFRMRRSQPLGYRDAIFFFACFTAPLPFS
jgi:hypothetical protein